MAQGLQHRKQQSADARRFAMVPDPNVPRSSFDIQHAHKTTFGSGYLVPVYVDEVLPGDSIRLKMTAFARLATPIVPIMDNMVMESFFFFVPNRLLWSRWAQFMGEQEDPADSTVYLVPQVEIDTFDDLLPGTLYDYMGIVSNAPQQGNVIRVCAFWPRAYNLIWNEWFRDEDLQDPVIRNMGDGPDDALDYTLLRRGKRFDYFTSCRPWPEKPINAQEFQGGSGGAAMLPGQGMLFPQAGAPVTGLGVFPGAAEASSADIKMTGGRQFTPTPNTIFRSDTAPFVMERQGSGVAGFPDVRVLINDIRTANAVQLLMEQRARGGTRYTELIRAAFGVTSPDARLQRPEYLGGGRTPVVVNPVAQTSASGVTGSTTVLGELAGVGTAVASGHGFSQSFTEHGVILGLVQIRADLTYQQGINRMWFRRTQFDYYWPAMANLGEQSVLSREIFSVGDVQAEEDVEVFGYQERWSEYKFKPNRTSGLFRSTVATPLDMWHLGQFFSDIGGTPLRPTLGDTFIEDNPPVERVLQTDANHLEEFLFDSLFDVRMARCMPMRSIPGLGPRL